MTTNRLIGFGLAAVAVVSVGIGFMSLRFRLSELEQQISLVRADLDPIVAKLKSDNEESVASLNEEPKTTAQAKELIERLGKKPAADVLAAKLAEIDAWAVTPEEEKSFVAYKLEQLKRLREF